jgi:hypothetical protein
MLPKYEDSIRDCSTGLGDYDCTKLDYYNSSDDLIYDYYYYWYWFVEQLLANQ